MFYAGKLYMKSCVSVISQRIEDEPELIEGDVFKTIVTLVTNMAEKVADKLTSGKEVLLKSLLPYFNEHELMLKNWGQELKIFKSTVKSIRTGLQ